MTTGYGGISSLPADRAAVAVVAAGHVATAAHGMRFLVDENLAPPLAKLQGQASSRRTSQRDLPPLRPVVCWTRSNPCAWNRRTVPTYAPAWSTRSPSGSTG